MAKSKNHTNHNQGYKNHRNGIKRPLRNKHQSLKGVNYFKLISSFLLQVNAKYLRNRRRAIKFEEKQNKHRARYVKNEDK